ncbi:MAG: prenyltransferase [Rhodocyclaceae bacterium]|nr:prenyltransferase [Rhodocyclaceae bacterium]
MPPAEPTLAALPSPFLRYFLATRPAFLSVTLMGCLLGLAAAKAGGIILDPLKATLTVLFAMVAHAGVNVINDYYDGQNGTDALNQERVFPFTGGSRFIQNGVLTLSATGRFGYALLVSVIPAGLWLSLNSAPGLMLIGLAGLLVGWAYSAPPLKLMSRGVGEFAVAAGFLLIVLGADFVQRGEFSFTPLAAGLGYALLVANVLYINQFPDCTADGAAGKRTVVVLLTPLGARWGYPLIAVIAHLWLILQVGRHALPPVAAVAALTLMFSLKAARILMAHAAEPGELEPAIKLTILAANLHGAVLAAVLVFAKAGSGGNWAW